MYTVVYVLCTEIYMGTRNVRWVFEFTLPFSFHFCFLCFDACWLLLLLICWLPSSLEFTCPHSKRNFSSLLGINDRMNLWHGICTILCESLTFNSISFSHSFLSLLSHEFLSRSLSLSVRCSFCSSSCFVDLFSNSLVL